MRISRQIPWRKVKVLVFMTVLLVIVHSLWSSTRNRYFESGVKYTDHQNAAGIPKVTRQALAPQHVGGLDGGENGEFKVHAADVGVKQTVGARRTSNSAAQGNTCDRIVPFKDNGDHIISTYDLPAQTDFSLASDGRYKIPDEFYEKHKNSSLSPPDEEINVILVPFSHTDPGYGQTVEQYYLYRTKNVLDNMVTFLSQHPNMTFQWVETVFLERWFRDIDETTKQKVRDLITKGQLEVVLGGWVMPDEAITYYMPVVDQLIEGHQWLLENLGVSPKNAWVNDPFGFSSTMPYLWKSSGIDNLVILRIHQAVKATLMKKRSLDFMWRPYWNSMNGNDILTNLMPYQNYWNSDVCGPNPRVCSKFNFLHRGFGRGIQDITRENVDMMSRELYDAYRFTASLFQFNNIIIFIGEDNSFDNMASWEDTYNNYEKLASYINAKKEWKMKIKFGTAGEYFENIRAVDLHAGNKPKFPILSGDFFPYSDKEDDYWTGYFTTRPWMKRFTREVEPILRAADRFSVLMHFHCVVRGGCGDISQVHKEILSALRDARREVGIYQHHDGITGTSLPFVVDDYEMRLQKAFASSKKALALSIVTILTNGYQKNQYSIVDNNVKETAQSILTPNIHRFIQNSMKLIVANTLEKPRVCSLTFYIEKREIGSISNVISYQISQPVGDFQHQKYQLLTVLVQLSPFELKTLEVVMKPTDGMNLSPYQEDSDRIDAGSDKVVSIKNNFMTVEFYNKNGSMKAIYDKNGRFLNISSEFLKYTPQKSGAYLFGPTGPAQTIQTLSNVQVTVATGPVYSQVKIQFSPGFLQKWTLYHTDDVKGQGLHLTQEITLGNDLREAEVVLRFKTDINNGNIFFTDQNGFQLMGRQTNRSRPIETNLYPITSMALIEDRSKRLTLHSAQSHGVASLEKGWLEVMLDRNMAHDDGKGLGMGATERHSTLTEFILQIEYKNGPDETVEPRYTHASTLSFLLNEQLQNKPELFSIAQEADKFHESFNIPEKVAPFPCDTAIVSLRTLVTNDLNINGTSLVLHRKPKHCSFPLNVTYCSSTDSPLNFQNFNFGLNTENMSEKIVETSLSHVHSLGGIYITDDIRPDANELRSFIIKT